VSGLGNLDWYHPELIPLYRYFQMGVSNFLLGANDVALEDFEEALLYLRGNQNMCVYSGAQV
jgi:hypothetical protein